ncbi:MAG: septum site-determining protein MinC [Neisseria sp.]|nr:septum site-determining protein MinC [Neisseria sp.]
MKASYKMKYTRQNALSLHLDSDDLTRLNAWLDEVAASYRELDMPVMLDVNDIAAPTDIQLDAVCDVLHEHGLRPNSLRHANAELWKPAAEASGLHFVSEAVNAESETPVASKKQETVRVCRPTVFINTPIRTGQQVYAEHADLIVTGVVSEGAEIIADGNIHVYAPMRGRALAGADGNRDARIFIHSMQAELVSVAGIYRNFEQDLPAHLHKQAVQVYLQDERLHISAI